MFFLNYIVSEIHDQLFVRDQTHGEHIKNPKPNRRHLIENSEISIYNFLVVQNKIESV